MNSISSRPARLLLLPVMKLSMPRTASPRFSNAAAIDRPMKPAAPVTRYLSHFYAFLTEIIQGSADLFMVFDPTPHP